MHEDGPLFYTTLLLTVALVLLRSASGTTSCCDSSVSGPDVDTDLEDGYRLPADSPDVLQVTCECARSKTAAPTSPPVRPKSCGKTRRVQRPSASTSATPNVVAQSEEPYKSAVSPKLRDGRTDETISSQPLANEREILPDSF